MSIICSSSRVARYCCVFFFFQAEDGIRDYKVTGVQTCALPISGAFDEQRCSIPAKYGACVQVDVEGGLGRRNAGGDKASSRLGELLLQLQCFVGEIGRASCRERG